MNNEIKFQLSPEHIDLLSYEFSENYINLLFDILQESLNRINKNYILLLKNLVNKVSFLKPDRLNQLKKFSDTIKETESLFLSNLNVIIQLIKLYKADKKKSKIYIILNPEDKNEFLKKLEERKRNIEKYSLNIKKLENLQENVNNIYEKMITSNSFSEDNH
jgi:hypothetical protein